jgi:5-methyltetrahydrofolate--homocysteine methyltransferase
VNALEPNIRPDCTDELTATLGQRIMVIDGAMGTAIQRDRPDEAGYRGDRFMEWPTALQGNNDLLTLTQPQIIEGIHREYLEAGADILRPIRSTRTRFRCRTTTCTSWATS